ncbi:MAG TPA: hypothetical protein VJ860_04210, partial [Polyangia bacterium]|nr:hypothetical protein [Polyangia bacterium]
DDDCDGIVDNCNVNGLALGACLNGGIWSCVAIGPAYCQPSDSNIGTVTPQTAAAPNGSFDWNCDGSLTRDPSFTAAELTPCESRTFGKLGTCAATSYYVVPLTRVLNCGDKFTATQYTCGTVLACTTPAAGKDGTYTQGCH